MEDNTYLLWASIIMIVFIIIAIIPITVEVAYDAKEVYYVDVPYQSPVYETVSHKEPIYETVSNNEPIYETVDHSDPIYETLYNVELRDESIFGDDVYKKSNVYNIDKVYSGSDTWGNSEYTFTLYYYTYIPEGQTATCAYYQIDDWSIIPYEGIVEYNEWSEEVIVGYNTYTDEIITGYDYWSEEVISHYETLYKSEEKSRNVTIYEPETRYLYQWIGIWFDGEGHNMIKETK